MEMSVEAFYFEKGKEVSGNADNYFTASENPYYAGIIMKPSTGVWELMKGSDTVNLRNGGEVAEFSIIYRIEVGENTIFFIRPKEGYSEAAGRILP